ISAMSLMRILLFLSILYQSDNLNIIFNLMSRHSPSFDFQLYVKWEMLANRPSGIIVNDYDIIFYRIIINIIIVKKFVRTQMVCVRTQYKFFLHPECKFSKLLFSLKQ